MHRFTRAIVVVALLGCNESMMPSQPPSFTVTPIAQWSGGTVTVQSAGFSGPVLPVLYAEGSALVVSRIDDTTLTVHLPVVPSGSLVLSRHASGKDTAGVVLVFGLDRYRLVSGELGWEPLVPEAQSRVVFVARGPGNGGLELGILDPGTDQISYVPGLQPVAESFGVQASYLENRFVLRDSSGQLGLWRLFPTPALLDTAGVQSTAARFVSQANDSTWITFFSNGVWVTTPSGVRTIAPGLYNDPLRVAYSADRSRIALVMASAPQARAPVIDAATGDTAYTVHAEAPTGVAFSPHADRLYVSAKFFQSEDSLLAVQTGDGVRLAGVALPPGFDGYGLAVDPKVDRLYQLADSSGTRALLIFDGSSLALLGQSTCSASCGNPNSWSAGIGVDTVDHKIHVAFPGSPAPVISFDRLP